MVHAACVLAGRPGSHHGKVWINLPSSTFEFHLYTRSHVEASTSQGSLNVLVALPTARRAFWSWRVADVVSLYQKKDFVAVYLVWLLESAWW